MLPLVLGAGLLLLAGAGGGSGGSAKPKGSGRPGSGGVVKGRPPKALIHIALGKPPDPLHDAATKARAYVDAHPEHASELASLAALARSKNRPDVAAILGASAAPAPRPVIHFGG